MKVKVYNPGIWLSDGADVASVRRGTNPQAVRVYNTYTNASNYERGTVSWFSNDFIFGAEAAGTGTARWIGFRTNGANRWRMNLTGDWLAVSDNASDIGASGATRPRSIYVGTDAHVGTSVRVGTNPASGGLIRCANNNGIAWRNAANSADAGGWYVDSNDILSTDVSGYPAGVEILLAANQGWFFTDDMLEQRNGTTAQGHRIYNTFTDSGNYERMVFDWSANIGRVYTESAGTGTARTLRLGAGGTIAWEIATAGHLLGVSDNSYDIGADGATRPRNVFVAGYVVAGAHGRTTTAGGFVFGDAANDYIDYDPATGIIAFTADSANVCDLQLWHRSSQDARVLVRTDAAEADPYYSWLVGATYWSFGMDNSDSDILKLCDSDGLVQANTQFEFLAGEQRVYNTTDGTNYENVLMRWSSNQWQMLTNAAGTGTHRSMIIGTSGGTASLTFRTNATNRWAVNDSGHFIASTDATYDIGDGTNDPRDIYLTRNLICGDNVRVSNGAEGSPSLSFTANTNMGLYRIGSNLMGISVSATARAMFSATAFQLKSDMALEWSSGLVNAASDLFLVRDAADIFAQRNGTTAQQINLYNTWTSSTNNEYLRVDWKTTANACEIMTDAGSGGGTHREIRIGTTGAAQVKFYQGNALAWNIDTSKHLMAGSDNAYDIGASGATRPRTIYAGTSVIAGTDEATATTTWQVGAFGASNAGMIVRNTTDNSELRLGVSGTTVVVGTQTAHTLTFIAGGTSAFGIDVNETLHPLVSLTTGMTTGFINIPGAAGAPSGTPATTTGFPLYYDSTNNRIYVYNGSWRSVAVS